MQYVNDIRSESKFYTAMGNGKAPWVSVNDIAKVAFKALTDDKPHNTDYRVTGPEQLTCDEVSRAATYSFRGIPWPSRTESCTSAAGS